MKSTLRRPRVAWLRTLLCATLTTAALAQATAAPFPTKPISLVAPFAAGGTSDAIARAVARLAEAELGQPVVVINRPGAGGLIGISSVFNTPADGYTLVLGGLGSVVFPKVIHNGKIKYDPARDLVPVAVIGNAPTVIAVRDGLPAKDLKELIAQAKAHPRQLSFASAGIGGTLHVAGVLLEKEAGIELNHVPYKGGAPAMTDLAAGSVDIALADLTLLKPLLQTGRIRPVAIASAQRSALLPGVPTTAELGLPKVRMDTWYAVFAPAGTPPDVLAKLRTTLDKVRANDALATVLEAQAITPLRTSGEAFQRQLDQDFATWLPLLTRICSESSCQ